MKVSPTSIFKNVAQVVAIASMAKEAVDLMQKGNQVHSRTMRKHAGIALAAGLAAMALSAVANHSAKIARSSPKNIE